MAKEELQTEEFSVINPIVNQDTTEFVAALEKQLRDDAGNFSDTFSAGMLRELVKNKPITPEEMDQIPALTDEFKSKHGTQVLNKINALVGKFNEKYPTLGRVSFEERYAIEQVALRNIRVADNNTMIAADHKVDNIIDVTTYKGINFEEVAKVLFNERAAEQYEGFNLGADDKVKELYKAQEEFISL